MDCATARDLIGAYLDGELGAERALELERHPADCPACRKALAAAAALSRVLKEKLAYHAAPAALRNALERNPRPARAASSWMRLAASFVLVAGLSAGATYYALPRPGSPVPDEVFASHVRGMLSETRMIDVASSDEHTVKPWFDTHIDFSPPVKDLTVDGFPLIGGRTDYIAGREVAALLFRHRQHVITLFIWPDPGAAQEPSTSERRGDNLVHWSDGEMVYWAVSDVNAADLIDFSQRYRMAPPVAEPGARPKP
jgi:anti-sigma factor (TIGR02949 family)